MRRTTRPLTILGPVVLSATLIGGCGSAPPIDADGGHMRDDFLTGPSAGSTDPAPDLTVSGTTDLDSGSFITGH